MPQTTVEEVVQAARERFMTRFMTDDVVFSAAVSQLAQAIATYRGMKFPKEPPNLNEEEYGQWLDENWTGDVSDRWQMCEWDAVRLIMQPLLEQEIPMDLEINLPANTHLGEAIADL